MNDSVTTTVLLPTTGEKGPVIQYSLASVLAQSVASIEVFVIGDGAGDSTRQVVHEFMQRDPRVQFFDYPKGQRRGETYRHDLLMNRARGRIVCYLCDRDLWCHDHVASLLATLESAEFATALAIGVKGAGIRQGRVKVKGQDLRLPLYRNAYVAGQLSAGMLSGIAHTLTMYRRLPRGWETTPEGFATDQYMWRKFLAHPDCRIEYSPRPTVLTFAERCWTEDVLRRQAALRTWWERLQQADWPRQRDAHFACRSPLRSVAQGRLAHAVLRARKVGTWLQRAYEQILRRAA
jgi:glycosyltransferase involved in cell wall biosynthesis